MARRKSEKFEDVKGPAWPIFVRLLKMAWRFRRQAILLIFLAALGIGLEIAQVRFIARGINSISHIDMGQTPKADLSPGVGNFVRTFWDPQSEFIILIRRLALIILGLAVLRGVVDLITRLQLTHFREKVVWQLRSRVFQSLQRMSFGYYDRHYSGHIINRATGDVQRIRGFIANVWYNAAQTILYIVGWTAIMLYISVPLTLVSVVLLPVAGFLMYKLAIRLRPAYREARTREDDLITALQENIAGTAVVKAFSQERQEVDRFHSHSETLYDRVMTTVDLFRHYMPLVRGLMRLDIVIVLAVGSYLLMRGEGSSVGRLQGPGDLMFFIAALGVIGGRMVMVMDLTNLVQEAIASAERVFEVLDARPDVAEKPHAQPLPPGTGGVVFENVSFRYVAGTPALRNINLEVQAGEVIGIAGLTGSCKTTLLALLPRFYDPDEGRVLIDGMDIRDTKLQPLRQSIGMVFQESFLFNDTIANNISFGVPTATQEQIERAARLARAHDFIMDMEHGYEAIVGERGETLSGGQRQRIALARALIKEPRILILDDAFASVDAQTEHAIVSGLDEILQGRTVFIISHRVSLLRRTDRIVVLDNGSILEIGTHDELMQRSGIYQKTATLQLTEPDDEMIEDILNMMGEATVRAAGEGNKGQSTT
jgi:ABC-type multidrug transport system fused ATPase/permease subunit